MKSKIAAAIVKKPYKFLDQQINWYPGHMRKATNQIEDQIGRTNLFMEIIDARAPVSTHNASLETIIPKRVKQLIIMNKADLAHKETTQRFLDYYKQKGVAALALNAKGDAGGQHLLKELRRLATPHFRSLGSWLMIAGIPNVGKSTIVNTLRKSSKAVAGRTKSAKVGPTPGVTRGLSGFKVSVNPLLYLIDTPGVMPTKVESNEVGYKLLLCGCVKEGIVDNFYLCDYLLHCFNERKMKEYMKLYDMSRTENLYDVVEAIQKKHKTKNVSDACDLMFKNFREGKLGKITFDEAPKE
eukprot:TRINITY_DN4463_c0_g1_i14.p1 TRINITY_DN4463_c0_g1~~TRINITY_DN4463_c0_g1_i14.p1  ORF type:complete len:298 (-),score=68.77 TRINITY_DN4463_c0_g1_i14:145-1038(-)